jgi:hypothetical protein
MPKQLRLSTITGRDGLTVRELKSFLNTCDDESPIVLKCGKNFRLGRMGKKVTKDGTILVLHGRRSGLK